MLSADSDHVIPRNPTQRLPTISRDFQKRNRKLYGKCWTGLVYSLALFPHHLRLHPNPPGCTRQGFAPSAILLS